MLADLPKILDTKLPPQNCFDQAPAFIDRYFWLEDAVTEVDHFDRTASTAWNKATGRHGDDGSPTDTISLCRRRQHAQNAVLTEKSAAALVRKIRKSGLRAPLANQYITDHAPSPPK